MNTLRLLWYNLAHLDLTTVIVLSGVVLVCLALWTFKRWYHRTVIVPGGYLALYCNQYRKRLEAAGMNRDQIDKRVAEHQLAARRFASVALPVASLPIMIYFTILGIVIPVSWPFI